MTPCLIFGVLFCFAPSWPHRSASLWGLWDCSSLANSHQGPGESHLLFLHCLRSYSTGFARFVFKVLVSVWPLAPLVLKDCKAGTVDEEQGQHFTKTVNRAREHRWCLQPLVASEVATWKWRLCGSKEEVMKGQGSIGLDSSCSH